MVLLVSGVCPRTRAANMGVLRVEMRVAVGGKMGRAVGIGRSPESFQGGSIVTRSTYGMRVGMVLKVDRLAFGRKCGWSSGRRDVGAVIIAARSFGGSRGPSRPCIATPRRPVEEEASSSGDEFLTNEDIRDDSTKMSLEVMNGVPKSEVPVDSSAQLLQDQFNRFAAAVALDDRKMAEDIIREMGDGESPIASSLDFPEEEILDSMDGLAVSAQFLDDADYHVPNTMAYQEKLSENIVDGLGGQVRRDEINQYVEDVTELERQLEELYQEVGRMVDEGDHDTARVLIEANYEALQEQLGMGVRGVEQAAMLDVLAQLYMDMDDIPNAGILLEKASELLEDISSPQPLLDSVLEHVANMYTAMEKPEKAIPFYIRSLNAQKTVYGDNNPLVARTMLGLAKAYGDNDEGRKSIRLYRQVLNLMESSNGEEDESLVLPLTHLGHTLLEEDKAKEAESVLRRAVLVTEKAYGSRDGRVGVATCALGRALVAQGQVDEAVHMYCQGLGIMGGCSRFCEDDPVMESVRTDLAELLTVLDRDVEAQELWEENLRVKEKMLGKNDVRLVPYLHNSAMGYARAGKFDECEPILRRTLKLMSVKFGPRAPQISVPLELLATSLHHLGRGLEAEPLAREAVSIRETHYGESHPSTGEAYNCLAAILHGVGKDNDAEDLLKKVLKIQEKELGSDSPELILTLELLAVLYHKQGRNAELQPLIRRMQKLESKLHESDDIRKV